MDSFCAELLPFSLEEATGSCPHGLWGPHCSRSLVVSLQDIYFILKLGNIVGSKKERGLLSEYKRLEDILYLADLVSEELDQRPGHHQVSINGIAAEIRQEAEAEVVNWGTRKIWSTKRQ